MLDHVSIGVRDLERSTLFYDRALRPLGIVRLYGDGTTVAGYGIGRAAMFWLNRRHSVPAGTHVAFAAPDRAAVDAFHAAALAAGGRDHGAPGLRPHYHADYYGGFILDPDGHNVEAVCRKPA